MIGGKGMGMPGLMALLWAVAAGAFAVDRGDSASDLDGLKTVVTAREAHAKTVALPAESPRIHLLIGADTLDPTIGTSVACDVTSITTAFVANVPPDRLVVEVCQGEQATRDEILAVIDRLAVKAADAVAFYWAGHGAYDEEGHWLKMRRAPNLYRQELQQRLLARHARLNVVISDCCNLYHPGKPKAAPPSPAIGPQPSVREPPRLSPLFDSLFFRSQGMADITAASKDEVAMGTFQGGLLTLALARMWAGNQPDEQQGFFLANQRKPLSWATLAEDVSRRVQTAFAAIDDLPANQRTQTLKVWSLPTPYTPPPLVTTAATAPMTPPIRPTRTIALRPGDLILAVNGTAIDDATDYWNAVKRSPPTMQFRIQRGARLADLQMELRSGEGSRSGVAADTNPGGGVVVSQVYPGEDWPGNRVAVLRVQSVFRLEENDVISSVNGQPLGNLNDYIATVKGSAALMRCEIIDARNGLTVRLKALLRTGEGSRFGVEAVDNAGGGVRIRRVYPGYPGTRVEPAD